MRKSLLPLAVLFVMGTGFMDAQFRTRNRQDKLESFDEQKFTWGFYLTGNRMGYRMVLNPKFGIKDGENLVSSKDTYGFGAGLIGKMKINETFDLRVEPAMHFVERDLYFNTQSNSEFAAGTLENPPFTPVNLTETAKTRKVKQTYIDVPIMIEMHGDRWFNTRPYIAAGVNYMINLQSNANNTEDNLQGVWRTTTHNFAYSGEAGIQLYFSKFKLTPAIRGTFMFNNELVSDKAGTPPYWTGALNSVQSRAIFFVLKFE